MSVKDTIQGVQNHIKMLNAYQLTQSKKIEHVPFHCCQSIYTIIIYFNSVSVCKNIK